MPPKYLNVLALSAIVFLACSFSPTPIAALSIDSNGLQARHAHIGQAFAKRAPKRCKARTPSPDPPASSTTPPNVNTPATNAPAPAATTPAAPAPPTSGRSGKAGLAYAAGGALAPTILNRFNLGHVSAIYNWGAHKTPPATDLGLEDIPMLWGERDLGAWPMVGAGYARQALGFNEPNIGAQANMNPRRAAEVWRSAMMPLKYNYGYSLISPATTSGPDGLSWMQDFINACGGECVDKIALHWYGTNPQEFISYLQLWYDTFKRPIYVTEFACMDFVNYIRCPDVMNFARTVRGFMDSQPWVEKYFPFVIAHDLGNVDRLNLLVTDDNYPTELAHIYFD